ncbi:MAG: hypothetical protein JL50_10050 [Peptococcaceae bacterium BICA1-7]|nr:MAG: hypothetical protein JL50_10050 [Peptococcaceae bacterium BICA1-7]HBV95625.1 hypothetical protein [Desulfotomaculum sp.]
MPYTFPVDSNNKAGAVKEISAGSEFTVPTQDTGYEAMNGETKTLVAATDTTFNTGGTKQEGFTVWNFGPGDAWVKVDGASSIEGAGCIPVKEGVCQPLPVRGTVVHAISSGTPKITVLGVA